MGFKFSLVGTLAAWLSQAGRASQTAATEHVVKQLGDGLFIIGNSALAGPGLGSKVWKNPLRLEMRYGGQCSG